MNPSVLAEALLGGICQAGTLASANVVKSADAKPNQGLELPASLTGYRRRTQELLPNSRLSR